MKHLSPFCLLLFCIFLCCQSANAQNPVIGTHPRLLINSTIKNQLLAKKNANHPDWLALKTQADELATRPVMDFNQSTISTWNNDYIFYTYEGGGWYDAALPLAFAHQMTKGNTAGAFPTAYSDKLIELAEEMISAQSDPANTCGGCSLPLEIDQYFPSRFLGMTIGIIYDYCYDELDATLKNDIIDLMNEYYDSLRTNAYQINDRATGNYFFGHVICSAAMGYASAGDNTRAAEMINFARIRFDGTPSALLAPENIPSDNLEETFEGGYEATVTVFTGGAVNITGNPNKGGLQIQGWAYGAGTMSRIIEYMKMVQTATNEDLFAAHPTWMPNLLQAFKHSLLPNRYEIDHIGDWGGDVVGIAPLSLAHRLSYILAGTTWGEEAQYLANTEILVHPTWGSVFNLTNWESFYYLDENRPSAPFAAEPLFYSGFNNTGYNLGNGNGAYAYFLMRNSWDSTATWASFKGGGAIWDDHQHNAAGALEIKQGDRYLLVDGNQFGNADENGIGGGSNQGYNSGQANTLFFSDYGNVYELLLDGGGNMSSSYIGGQTSWGWDDIKAVQMGNQITYIRTDATYAYTMPENYYDYSLRPLRFFYRNFLYLRSANIFVVYDQAKARTSTHPNGAYDKAQRWHFTANPTVSGNHLQSTYGDKRLYTHIILPTSPLISTTFENPNPDSDEYALNSDTWRAEIRHPSNPLYTEFMSVFQPGTTATVEMNSTALASATNNMKGTKVTLADNTAQIVLFNTDTLSLQTPVSSTSYSFNGGSETTHTLLGMTPSGAYNITYDGSAVSVNAATGGAFAASAQGVLRFCVFKPLISGDATACSNYVNIYSVPASGEAGTVYNWSVSGGTILSAAPYGNSIEVQWDNGSSGTVSVTQIVP